jgi:hypothetical protein
MAVHVMTAPFGAMLQLGWWVAGCTLRWLRPDQSTGCEGSAADQAALAALAYSSRVLQLSL